MKKNFKKFLLFILFVGVISLLLTFFNKDIQSNSVSFGLIFFDRLFLINLLIFIIAGFIFVDDQGTFNVFKYSTKHFLATVSNKYKYSIQQENSLKSNAEIKDFLKKKYLYAPKKHSSTTIYFYYSCVVFTCFLLYFVVFFD